ncbi:hypothetical protein G9C85_16740 [Halorubellus sp. JP-L1]|uniref:hypothetical protein n=1 Tax=Halorubellus sp. JP-L1 TaxID=2715753 RepID=UPI00140A4E76|nr:hypothetical protein [Halorubellus sp. JP-L1]NHN43266.1 hypothetical protein [Halorubellus sp. JP-L1]
MQPALIAENLPQWIGAPLLQLSLLVVGILLERTYVNRLTTLAGALALFSHELLANENALWVGVYLDVGLLLGVYGLYCYVEAIPVVTPAVKLVSYFAYAPMTVLLVIVLPHWLFPAALLVGAALNYKLVEELAPAKPYFWGSGDREPGDGIDLDDVEEYVERTREFVEDRLDEYGGDTAR